VIGAGGLTRAYPRRQAVLHRPDQRSAARGGGCNGAGDSSSVTTRGLPRAVQAAQELGYGQGLCVGVPASRS
jgi:hypothetical protein